MKLRSPIAAALALAACLAAAVPALGHHPREEAMESMEALPFADEGTRQFNAALAAAPPLEGVGDNMEIVANVPLGPGDVPGGADDHEQFTNNAADIEAAGDHLYVGSYTQGLVIVNIATCNDPARPDLCKPFVEGVLPCSGGQFDIQLSPDANVAVMAHESASANKDCHPNEEGAQIIDVSDKAHPAELAFISDRANITGADPDGTDSDRVEDGAHNVTLDWPLLYIDQYTTYPTTPVPPDEDQGKAEIYNLSDPASPQLVSEIDFDGTAPAQYGETGFHDSYPDHRPDGKHLLYGASIQKSDIIDISDPAAPVEKQTIVDPQVGISHGAEPNHKRDVLIVTDEYGGGTGVAACGESPSDGGSAPGLQPGQVFTPVSDGVGAVHFYKLDPATGLVPEPAANNKHGIFNIDYQANTPEQIAAEAGCTSHVFWQAPDQNRMTIAWYGRGTRIVDFNDPANPRELGSFIPKGADTWSAKPHCGFIYTGDMVRGVDVLRYTGENGGNWPSTSGRADAQRAQIQQGGGSGDARPCRAATSGAGEGSTSSGSSQADRCGETAMSAGTRRVGRARLGRLRRTVRRTFGSDGAYRRLVDRFCLRQGGAIRVGYLSARGLARLSGSERRRVRGRAVLVLSSGSRTSIAGIRPGSTLAALRKRFKGIRGVRVGTNVWYASRTKSHTRLFKGRRGRVQEVGLADRRLAAGRKSVRRLLLDVR